MTSRFDDACRAAAQKLIASIAAGDAGDWHVPWRSPAGLVSPINAATGKRYESGNWILAMLTAFDCGWTSGRWATYKQWQSLGRQVARGEKGTQLVRWVPPKKNADADAESDDSSGRRLVPFVFSVFAAEQLVPDPDACWQAPEPLAAGDGLNPHERHDELDAWIAATGAEIHLGGARAYYVGGTVDRIHVPDHNAWDLWGDFYSTVVHDPLSARRERFCRRSQCRLRWCVEVGSDRGGRWSRSREAFEMSRH